MGSRGSCPVSGLLWHGALGWQPVEGFSSSRCVTPRRVAGPRCVSIVRRWTRAVSTCGPCGYGCRERGRTRLSASPPVDPWCEGRDPPQPDCNPGRSAASAAAQGSPSTRPRPVSRRPPSCWARAGVSPASGLHLPLARRVVSVSALGHGCGSFLRLHARAEPQGCGACVWVAPETPVTTRTVSILRKGVGLSVRLSSHLRLGQGHRQGRAQAASAAPSRPRGHTGETQPRVGSASARGARRGLGAQVSLGTVRRAPAPGTDCSSRVPAGDSDHGA